MCIGAQGHEAYLERFGSYGAHPAPPWGNPGVRREVRAMELCEVRAISYHILPEPHLQTACRVTLALLDGSAGEPEAGGAGAGEGREGGAAAQHVGVVGSLRGRQFEVLLVDACRVDFLVETWRYQAALDRHWSVGQRCQASPTPSPLREP